MAKKKQNKSRRQFIKNLSGVGLGGLGTINFGSAIPTTALELGLFSTITSANLANASQNYDSSNVPRVAMLYLAGGADALVGLDPRDNRVFNTRTSTRQTETRLDLTSDQRTLDLLAGSDTNISEENSGLIKTTNPNLYLGPAGEPIKDLIDEATIAKGIYMATNTHAIGRAYGNTGEFPNGTAPAGSSLASHIVNQSGHVLPVPNSVYGKADSYTKGLNAYAAAFRANTATDYLGILERDNALFSPFVQERLDRFVRRERCESSINRSGQSEKLIEMHQSSLELLTSGLADEFKFGIGQNNNDKETFLNAFGLDLNAPNFSSLRGQAALAAHCLQKNVCQSVKVTISASLDTHNNNWGTLQIQRQRAAYEIVRDFINYLKNQPLWENLAVIVYSEFSRTPYRNPNLGNDHWNVAPQLFLGGHLKGNQTLGSTDDNYYGVPFDPTTGATDLNQRLFTPGDYHATILDSFGMDYSHYRDAIIIDALKK